MRRKHEIISTLMFAIVILLSACKTAQQVDPGTIDPTLKDQELFFWNGRFQDEEGFVFGGFPLTTKYEVFEHRMELTETQLESSVVSSENRITGKTETSVSIILRPDEDLNATIAYYFYDGEFLGGDLKIEGFSDYESAKQFLQEIANEIEPYNVGVQSEDDPNFWGEWEDEGIQSQYHCQYLDKRNVKVEMRTQAESGKWWIYLRLAENVSNYGMKNNDSWYFDFSPKE